MKTIGLKLVVLTQLIFVLSLLGCKKDEVQPNTTNTSTSGSSTIASQIAAYPKEPLSDAEIKSLLIMREEEKLAHDVYVTLYAKWNQNVFSNIAASEQTHTEAVLSLLNKYELTDPVGSNGVGVFKDTTLQKLYTQLVNQGNISQLEAFKVGATIEDLDIHDLNTQSASIDNQDVKFVYSNLTKGSRNHMRSFYSQVLSAGGTYSAQFISQAELDAIINSAKETGAW